MNLLKKLFNMARPKKITTETVEPLVEDTVEVIPSGVCFHCRRSGTEFRCAKGDRNQYKFCSIECFNADKTV